MRRDSSASATSPGGPRLRAHSQGERNRSWGKTLFVNAAILDEHYRLMNPCRVVDVTRSADGDFSAAYPYRSAGRVPLSTRFLVRPPVALPFRSQITQKADQYPGIDSAEYLDSPEMVAGFISEFFDRGDSAYIAGALGITARAKAWRADREDDRPTREHL